MRTRQGSKVFAWIRPLRHWWKLLSWIWGVILLGVVINVGSSWVISSSLPLKHTPLGWLLDHPTITFPLAGTFLLLTVLSYLASRQGATQTQELVEASLAEMAADMVAGEQQVALTGGDRSQLSSLLHMKSEAAPTETSAGETKPTRTRRTISRPGTRKPKRDPVGE